MTSICAQLRNSARQLNKTQGLRFYNVWNGDMVVNSPFQDIVVPDMTIVDYVWRNLDKWPSKTAVVCGVTGRSYTYEKLYKKSKNLAANLRKKFNIRNDEVVGIISPNVPEYPLVSFASLQAGAVVTTFNPIYTAHEIKRQIELSDVKIMISHNDIVPVLKEALKLAKIDIPIISININQPLPENTISLAELIEDDNIDCSILNIVDRAPEDVAFLLYSSGTTGLPKGVELTNSNLIANSEQQNTEIRQYRYTTENNQDVTMAVLPMFHSYGLSILMLHKLASGLKLVTLPKFQPESYLNALLKYRINLLYVAPPMVLFMGSNPLVTPRHFETVHKITSGAAPLPRADINKMLDQCPDNVSFYQGYGLTETSPLATMSDPSNKVYESVGYAVPSVKLRVVDSEMRNLGPDKTGELLIKGPNVMKGYRNNLEANKETILEGGWLRTGDIAKIDKTGLVYITDRLKELIKVKGYQVPPAELESVLKEHPAVHDAACVGIPDPITGERPKAFLVLKPGAAANHKEIVDFVAERVAPYKRIKDVEFIETIPKNASGKILRRMLR
ncbi:hypothetical protein ACJJTC_006359 [Scirpophaga incertulas]